MSRTSIECPPGGDSPTRYRLSRRATVTFRVQRARTERRSERRRTVFRTLKGSFTDRASAGRNRHRFKGQLGGRALKSGRYRLRGSPAAATAAGPSCARCFSVRR